MKKLLTAALLITCIFSTYCQEKEESKSKAIVFSEKDGSLMKKEFYDLPPIKSIEITCIVFTDELTKQKNGYLRIGTSSYSSVLGNENFYGALDYDEIDACIKSLTYIQSNTIASIPTLYTECEYKTRDGVRIGVFLSSKGKKKDSESKWSLFIRTKSYTDKSLKFLEVGDIPALIDEMTQAKSILKEKLM